MKRDSAAEAKQPVPLDLFISRQCGYDVQVILINKPTRINKVLDFLIGRGAQESILGEPKGQFLMDSMRARILAGHPIYLFCSISAHNSSLSFK